MTLQERFNQVEEELRQAAGQLNQLEQRKKQLENTILRLDGRRSLLHELLDDEKKGELSKDSVDTPDEHVS